MNKIVFDSFDPTRFLFQKFCRSAHLISWAIETRSVLRYGPAVRPDTAFFCVGQKNKELLLLGKRRNQIVSI
jgi:hypothetical protein